MDAIAKAAPLLGRILLAAIFVQAGIAKLGGPGHAVAMMASHGVPQPHLLVFGAIAVELGGGLLLMAGWHARLAALVLFFYTLTLALIFHAYWTATGAEAATQQALFYGHLSMMGGMLYVFAYGPGLLSVDEAAHSRGAQHFFRLKLR
ncbi:MAG TPA: DoxX family protein [Stellaceae bacterium]|jgi:putative oxidoreductase|nr:DoxX family protein [Stellaceae bacterium]